MAKFDNLKINNFLELEDIFPKIKKDVIFENHKIKLVFDNNKCRLGYGKGFYDRYLNKYLKIFKNILTVGVAFSFQKHHKLPLNDKDVKLNYILTEKGIY